MMHNVGRLSEYGEAHSQQDGLAGVKQEAEDLGQRGVNKEWEEFQAHCEKVVRNKIRPHGEDDGRAEVAQEAENLGQGGVSNEWEAAQLGNTSSGESHRV